jgi:hypothetical protein
LAGAATFLVFGCAKTGVRRQQTVKVKNIAIFIGQKLTTRFVFRKLGA